MDEKSTTLYKKIDPCFEYIVDIRETLEYEHHDHVVQVTINFPLPKTCLKVFKAPDGGFNKLPGLVLKINHVVYV